MFAQVSRVHLVDTLLSRAPLGIFTRVFGAALPCAYNAVLAIQLVHDVAAVGSCAINYTQLTRLRSACTMRSGVIMLASSSNRGSLQLVLWHAAQDLAGATGY
jgi:hypothetical protein